MLFKSVLLAACLLTGPSVAPSAEGRAAEVGVTFQSDDAQSVTISGPLGAYVHAQNGWTYFMLGNVLVRTPTDQFPYPNPEFGTWIAAPNCYPDTYGYGADYVCNGGLKVY